MSLYDEAARLPGHHDGGFGPCDDGWLLVKHIAPTSPSGRASDLYVRRMPAHFYRLVSGDLEITTGSGGEGAELVERIAAALASGMIAFHGSAGFGRADAMARE